jgi:hypothetical protein
MGDIWARQTTESFSGVKLLRRTGALGWTQTHPTRASAFFTTTVALQVGEYVPLIKSIRAT